MSSLNFGQPEAMFSSPCRILTVPSSIQRVDNFASISSEICFSSGQFTGRKERKEKVFYMTKSSFHNWWGTAA